MPAPPLPSTLPPPVPTPPAPGAGASLTERLGLAGRSRVVVQRLFLESASLSCVVRNDQKETLFTVRLDVAETVGTMIGDLRARRRLMGTRIYRFLDSAGAVVATLSEVPESAHLARSTQSLRLTDGSGTPWFDFALERSAFLGRFTATGSTPDGRPVLRVQASTNHHNFEITDPSGGTVAKVHESWLAVRDTYAIEIVGPIEPLGPIVFGIWLDFAKAARSGGEPGVRIG